MKDREYEGQQHRSWGFRDQMPLSPGPPWQGPVCSEGVMPRASTCAHSTSAQASVTITVIGAR